MVRRWLLLAWLALAALAMLGSGRGSYEGGSYAGRAGSYVGGTVATWDTLTVLFTMDSTYTSAAAGDTHKIAQHNYWVNNADAVYILGTGNDVEDFAYGIVDSSNPTGYNNGRFLSFIAANPISGSDPLSLDIRFNYPADRRSHLLYIPFENYIPANSTIVSAEMNVWNYGTAYYTNGDTMISVLMAGAGDNAWYGTKGITTFPNAANVSWRRQVSATWGATASDPWSPTLNDREYPWEFGDYWDYSGATYAAASILPAETGYSVSIKNCVQGAVNGATNNGIIFIGADNDGGTPYWSYHAWDEDATSANTSPFIVVKYITKRYQKPFGSAEWAAVFTTDDAKLTNSEYVGTVRAHGGYMTIYVAETQLPRTAGGGAATAAMDSLMAWLGYGMEIGAHSRHHYPNGLRQHQPADTSSVEWANLLDDASPEWLYSAADSLDGDQRRSEPYFGKSMALPQNEWSPFVMRAIADLGYEAVRVGGIEGPIDTGDYRYRAVANERPGVTDSLFAGVTLDYQREPRNMIGLPFTTGISVIVGDTAAASKLSEAEVKQNIKRLIAHVIGDGRRVISLFWHDDRASTAGYSEAMDNDDFDYICDIVDEMGGRYMRASEYARWIRRFATPVSTPAGYAQEDSFKFDAGDRVWFRPDGVDKAFIRGVR